MTRVTYKNLSFMGFPNCRVGDDGSVWEKRSGVWELLVSRPCNKRTGHLVVSLRYRKSRLKMLVHRLVLLAFIGPCPEGMECRHFPDRDPSNNNLGNLQWGTRKQNHQDRIVHGTNNAGEANGSAVTTEEVVLKIRRLHATGEYQQKEIAEMTGLTKSNVWCIVNRISWKHL